MIAFEVPGCPVPKGRPRVTRTGHAFTPKRTRDYESKVAMIAAQQMSEKGYTEPFNGELTVSVIAYLPKPKKPKEKLNAPLIRSPSNGDVDNYSKAALDAIEGIVFENDSQITALTVKKRYDKTPRLLVSVEESQTREECRE
jgi:Holliday junction resolvase RusA-like endonuclease